MFFQEFSNIEEAIETEKRIKKWSRTKKVNLIKTINPGFKDLNV